MPYINYEIDKYFLIENNIKGLQILSANPLYTFILCLKSYADSLATD